MPKFVKVLFAANVALLTWNILNTTGNFAGLTYAQRPPETNPDGVPFLKVNINPTNVPPVVDINPNQAVPKVEVTNFPEIRLALTGCANGQNFQTEIGNSISGPLVVTYLNLSPQSMVILADGQNSSQSINLGSTASPSTAIYLRAGQRMEFDSSIMYSGCKP